jgi:hypothetical protein
VLAGLGRSTLAEMYEELLLLSARRPAQRQGHRERRRQGAGADEGADGSQDTTSSTSRRWRARA